MSRQRDAFAAELEAEGHTSVVELWHELERLTGVLTIRIEEAVTVATGPAPGGIITACGGGTGVGSERALDYLDEIRDALLALTGERRRHDAAPGGECVLCRLRQGP